jgi:hypothetical protein
MRADARHRFSFSGLCRQANDVIEDRKKTIMAAAKMNTAGEG